MNKGQLVLSSILLGEAVFVYLLAKTNLITKILNNDNRINRWMTRFEERMKDEYISKKVN